MTLEFEPVQGQAFDDAARALGALGGIVEDVAVQNALRAAASVVLRKAKRSKDFKDRTGRLRRKGVRVYPGKKMFFPSFIVKMGGRGARQAHLLEKGTKDRYQKTTDRFLGRIKPRKILENAVEKTRTNQANAMLRSMAKSQAKVEAALQRFQETGKLDPKIARQLNAQTRSLSTFFNRGGNIRGLFERIR